MCIFAAVALIPSVLSSADSSPSKHPGFDYPNFQLMCMERLLGIETCNSPGAALLGLRLQRKPAEPREPCKWKGVHCEAGVIDEINWQITEETVKHRAFSFYLVQSFRWFPQTVERLKLSKQHIDAKVDTRYLPRALKRCEMKECGLQGDFELRTLPSVLEVLLCPRNNLQGVAHLTLLPDTVRVLDFSGNGFRRAVVSNGDLPDALAYCVFENMKRHIFRIDCVDGGAADGRITRCASNEFFELARDEKVAIRGGRKN